MKKILYPQSSLNKIDVYDPEDIKERSRPPDVI